MLTHPTSQRKAKPGPMLPTLLERIPYDVLARCRMEAPPAGDPPKGDAPPEPKNFDQAAVDRIVADRLARERATKGDYDDLKKAKEELDKLKAAGQSEQEKAVAKAAKDAETAARSDERTKGNSRVLRAEVKALAGTRFASPADALALVDLTGLKVDDDGTVDEAAISKRLDDLLAEKPYLAAGVAPQGNGKGTGLNGLGQGNRPPAGKPSGREQGLAEAERRFGPKPEKTRT